MRRLTTSKGYLGINFKRGIWNFVLDEIILRRWNLKQLRQVHVLHFKKISTTRLLFIIIQNQVQFFFNFIMQNIFSFGVSQQNLISNITYALLQCSKNHYKKRSRITDLDSIFLIHLDDKVLTRLFAMMPQQKHHTAVHPKVWELLGLLCSPLLTHHSLQGWSLLNFHKQRSQNLGKKGFSLQTTLALRTARYYLRKIQTKKLVETTPAIAGGLQLWRSCGHFMLFHKLTYL